jgi:hypothetical protein
MEFSMHTINSSTDIVKMIYGRFSLNCLSTFAFLRKLNKPQIKPLAILCIALWGTHFQILLSAEQVIMYVPKTSPPAFKCIYEFSMTSSE